MPQTPDSASQDFSIRLIPLSRIKQDPNNTRHLVDPKADAALEASLASEGLLTPVKVRPAPGLKDLYVIVGGHRRHRAAQKLGWTEIRAVVLSIDENQAVLEGILDNRGQELTWLEIYESVERLSQAFPDLTQEEVASKLMLTQPRVSHALRCLKLLDKPSRNEIYTNSISPEKPYFLPESCMQRMESLARGETTDARRVGQAIRVVLKRRLTEAKVARLVAWMKAGKDPEQFHEDARAGRPRNPGQRFDPQDPKASLWQALPKSFKVRRKGRKCRVVLDLPEPKAVVAAYGAAAWLNELESRQGKGDPQAPYQKLLPSLFEKSLEALRASHEKPAARAQAPAPPAETPPDQDSARTQSPAPPALEEPAGSVSRVEQARLKLRGRVEKVIGSSLADRIGYAADDLWKAVGGKKKPEHGGD